MGLKSGPNPVPFRKRQSWVYCGLEENICRRTNRI